MKEFLDFEILDIKPKAKQSFRIGKGNRGYKTKALHDFESRIKSAAKFNMECLEIPSCDTPLHVDLELHFKIPKSYSKKKREELHMTYKLSRPDIDNISKGVIDSLSGGVAYLDDNQVSKLTSTKIWNKFIDKIRIKIFKLKGKYE